MGVTSVSVEVVTARARATSWARPAALLLRKHLQSVGVVSDPPHCLAGEVGLDWSAAGVRPTGLSVVIASVCFQHTHTASRRECGKREAIDGVLPLSTNAVGVFYVRWVGSRCLCP